VTQRRRGSSGSRRRCFVCSLLSALCFLLSAFCFLLSALCSLLSALCSLLSALSALFSPPLLFPLSSLRLSPRPPASSLIFVHVSPLLLHRRRRGAGPSHPRRGLADCEFVPATATRRDVTVGVEASSARGRRLPASSDLRGCRPLLVRVRGTDSPTPPRRFELARVRSQRRSAEALATTASRSSKTRRSGTRRTDQPRSASFRSRRASGRARSS